MAEAKIRVSLEDGIFEIEGSEAFVSDQAEKFGDAIRKALSSKSRQEASPVTKAASSKKPDEPGGEGPPSADYSDVFELHDGKVQVLKDLSGSSSREKMVNAGVICAFANEIGGASTVTFNQIRQICKDHSCLDSPNFAAALKKDGKEYFVFSGAKKSQALKLSVPGKKKAKELIASMRA